VFATSDKLAHCAELSMGVTMGVCNFTQLVLTMGVTMGVTRVGGCNT
jgi:hypothetical protein